MKSDSAIQELKSLYLADHRVKYPNLPEAARVSKRYQDRTANGLTSCIIDFLNLSGHQAERISCTGRYIDRRKRFKDVLGHEKQIGTAKWVPASMTPGTADISATIKGQSIKIECKIGRDRQSENQKKYQADVERAGGLYFIARTFEDFLQWYKEFI